MKGFYILVVLVLMFGVLGYLVMKPTDSDIQRFYNTIREKKTDMDGMITGFQPILKKLRKLKKRTNVIDEENNKIKRKSREIEIKLTALENIYIGSGMQKGVDKALIRSQITKLDAEIDRLTSSANVFGTRVTVIFEFISEWGPAYLRMQELMNDIGMLIEKRDKEGRPFTKETMKDLESFSSQCNEIVRLSVNATKTIHSSLNEGVTLSKTTIKKAKDLIPEIKNYLIDLKK